MPTNDQPQGAPTGDESVDPLGADEQREPIVTIHGEMRAEPMEAAEAYALRDSMADDPSQSAVLMPTLDSLIDASRRPGDTLTAIRTLVDSLDLAVAKAVQIDVSLGDRSAPAVSGTAVTLENALVDLYGPEPRALARTLMQSRLDVVLHEMLPEDDEADAPTEAEPAAPVEPESTRAANEHEVTDALSTVENVVWGLAIETMPGGGTRFTLPDDQDAHMQSWLAATAMDAAEQSIQEAGVGNGVDRLRVIRGILSLALAHVGEAIQTLEPDAQQIGTATSASGVEHTMRLGDQARTPDGKTPGYYPGSVARAVGDSVAAAIASLETGAEVEADVDFGPVTGFHLAPGDSRQTTLPIALTVTGVQR